MVDVGHQLGSYPEASITLFVGKLAEVLWCCCWPLLPPLSPSPLVASPPPSPAPASAFNIEHGLKQRLVVKTSFIPLIAVLCCSSPMPPPRSCSPFPPSARALSGSPCTCSLLPALAALAPLSNGLAGRITALPNPPMIFLIDGSIDKHHTQVSH